MSDRFEIGQGVRYSDKGSVSGEMTGLVIGTRDKTLTVVSVYKRRSGTRFYDESENSTDSFKDNVLLHCEQLFSDLRDGAYNDDCYATADAYHTDIVPKEECELLDDGEKVPEDDVATVLDHVHRSVRQKDLRQEELDAARKAPARRVLPSGRSQDGVPEPEPGLELVREYRRRHTAALLEEKDRERARHRAGPGRARSDPAAEEPSLKSRLDALTSGIKPPGRDGHGGLGG